MEIAYFKEKLDKEEKENIFLIDEKNELINNLTIEKEKFNDLKLTIEMVKSERDLLADELSKIIPQFEKLKEVEENFHLKQIEFENSKLKSEENINNGISQSLEYMNLLKDFKKQLEIKANLIDEANPTGKIEVITESIKELDENYALQFRDMTDKINLLVNECNTMKQELDSKDQIILSKDKSIQEEIEKNKQYENTIEFLNNKITYYSNTLESDSTNKSLSFSQTNKCAAKYIEYLENAFVENKKFTNNIVLHYGFFDKMKHSEDIKYESSNDDSGSNSNSNNNTKSSKDILSTNMNTSSISEFQKIINDKDLEIQSLNKKLNVLLHQKEMFANSEDTNNTNSDYSNNIVENGRLYTENSNLIQSDNNNNNTKELEELRMQITKLKEALDAKTNLIMEFSDIEKNNTDESFVIYENGNRHPEIMSDPSKQTIEQSTSSILKKPESDSSTDLENNLKNKEFLLDKEDFYKIKNIILEIQNDNKEREDQIEDLIEKMKIFIKDINTNSYTIEDISNFLKQYIENVNSIYELTKIYNFQFDSFISSTPEHVDKSTTFSNGPFIKCDSNEINSSFIKKPIFVDAKIQTSEESILKIDSYSQTNNENINFKESPIISNDVSISDQQSNRENDSYLNKQCYLDKKFYKLLNTLNKLLEGESKKSKIIKNACQKKMNKNKNILSLTKKDSDKLMTELNKLLQIQNKIKDYLNKHMKDLRLINHNDGDSELISNTTTSENIDSLDVSSFNFDDTINKESNENLKLLARLDDVIKSLNLSNEIKGKLEEKTKGLLRLWKFEMNKYNELFNKYENLKKSFDNLKSKSLDEKKSMKDVIDKYKNLLKENTNVENDLKNKNKVLNDQNIKLTKKIEKLIIELKNKKNREDEILQYKKNNLIYKIDNLSKNLNNLNNDALSNDYFDKKKVSSIINENSNLLSKNQELEGKLKETEYELENTKRNVKNEINNMNGTIKNLTKIKETLENNNNRLQNEVNDLQKLLLKLKDNSNNELVKMLEDETERLTNELNQAKELLTKERSRSNSELEKLKQIYEIRYNRLNDEKNIFKREVDQIKDDKREFEIEIEKHKSIKNDLLNKIEQLNENYNKTKKFYDRRLEEYNKRMMKLNDIEKKNSEYETNEDQIKTLTDRLEESEKIIKDLNCQLEKITDEKGKIYMELTSQLNKINKEIVNQNKKIQSLNREKSKDQKEIEHFKTNIQKLTNEKQTIKKELDLLLIKQKQNNNLKIKSINQNNEDLISLLKAEISKLKIKVIQLKNQKNTDPLYNKNYLISIISIFFYKIKIANKEKEILKKQISYIKSCNENAKNKKHIKHVEKRAYSSLKRVVNAIIFINRTKKSIIKWKFIKNISPMFFNNYILSYKYISSHINNIIAYRNKIQTNLNKINNTTKKSSNSSTIYGSNNDDDTSISEFSEIKATSIPTEDTRQIVSSKYTTDTINNNINSNDNNSSTILKVKNNNSKNKNNYPFKPQLIDKNLTIEKAKEEIQKIRHDLTNPELNSEWESKSESKSEIELVNHINNNKPAVYELLNTIHDNLNKIKYNYCNDDDHSSLLKNKSIDLYTPSIQSDSNDTLTTSYDISTNFLIDSNQQQSLSDEIYSTNTPKKKFKERKMEGNTFTNNLYDISELSNISDMSIFTNEKSSLESDFSFENISTSLSYNDSSDDYLEGTNKVEKNNEGEKQTKQNKKPHKNLKNLENNDPLNITKLTSYNSNDSETSNLFSSYDSEYSTPQTEDEYGNKNFAFSSNLSTVTSSSFL
ncbi:hypothetical protein BCR36DRAFT_314744 [Piromyces finnis]|uniref:Uncharacterized protein n=1 Tax=Piromyces finnis TaxID=1754191 RepID=A0A1Y1VN70_9FUNG|nr:hypothetical protein BCR36DRAFT_314744 [Piromyces finnis]|eukprot:ORX60855.1 hypothetical protein BCR36DRAFT_314744 [Piromyces finnis]